MTNHIGIVACSPPGAALCYEAILTEAAATGMEPEVSMHAHPFLDYMRHVESNNWKRVAELMLSSAEKLARAGAGFLIAPCNTIHYAFEMVKSCSPLPWLHIAEEVASAARRSDYGRLALLGTRKTIEGEVYSAKLAAADIEFLIPGEQERLRIDRFIFDEMVRGSFSVEAREYFESVICRMQNEGCDAAALCCTELPILFRETLTRLPLLNSTRILASAALRRVTC